MLLDSPSSSPFPSFDPAEESVEVFAAPEYAEEIYDYLRSAEVFMLASIL